MAVAQSPATPGRVFVTGALGFIGRAVAERYRAAGAEVRGVDLGAEPALGVVAGDTTIPGPWQRHAEGCDLVVHAAASVSFAGSERAFWPVNVMGTRHALDAAVRGGARRFVHLSSVTAFSFDFPDGVDETYPVRTNGTPYVDTKVAGEQVVLQAHAAGEIPCTIVRPGDVYGPGSRPWVIVPLQLIRAGRFVLPASGRGVFSPIYVDNLVDGLLSAAADPAAAGQVFTLTDGIGLETQRFFTHHCRWLGGGPPRTAPTFYALPLAAAAGRATRLLRGDGELNAHSVRYLSRHATYSIAKARRVLGFQPAVDLETGLERTREWCAEAGLLRT